MLFKFTGSKQMERVSHCCSSNNIINSNSNNNKWFHCKTVTCRAELKLFKMLSPPFMSSAASSTSWQLWFLSKERLLSGFTFYSVTLQIYYSWLFIFLTKTWITFKRNIYNYTNWQSKDKKKEGRSSSLRISEKDNWLVHWLSSCGTPSKNLLT